MVPPTLKALSLVLLQSICAIFRQYRRFDCQFCDRDGGASSLNAAASKAVNEQHALWRIQITPHAAHLRTVRLLAPDPVFDIIRRPYFISIVMRKSRLTRILDLRSKRPDGFNVQWSLVDQHNTVLPGVDGCYVEMTKSTYVHSTHLYVLLFHIFFATSLNLDTLVDLSGVHLAMAWEAQAGFDLLIFGLTIAKSTEARRQRQDINSLIKVEMGLIDLIYRDGELLPTHISLSTCPDHWGIRSGILGHAGAIYFFIMVLANLSNIFTFYFAPDGLRGCLSTFASWYVPPLRHLSLNYTPTHPMHSVSVTMMSRLMLNLHEVASSMHTLHDTSLSSGATIAFTIRIDPPVRQTGLDGLTSLSSRTPQPTRVPSSQGTTGRSTLSSPTALSLFTNKAGSASGSGSNGGASAGRETGGTLRSELQEIDIPIIAATFPLALASGVLAYSDTTPDNTGPSDPKSPFVTFEDPALKELETSAEMALKCKADKVSREMYPGSRPRSPLHVPSPVRSVFIWLRILGSEFCVGFFDRDGITFSPKRDVWNDTKDFIRSMACAITHPGLAKYLAGGDMRDPRRLGLKEVPLLTVRHIRLEAFDPSAVTPVLHRLITSTTGRPLWEYSSDLELLKGMRAALDGHRFLYDQGILHGDISAANILLAVHPLNAPPGHEGFITDLEFARVEGEVLVAESTVEQVPSMINLNDSTVPMTRVRTQFTSASAQRGATMTGTLQFMATELLKAIKNKKPILQTVQHDVESFVWVLAYSTMRKLLSARSSTVEHDELNRRFRASFGRLVVDEIWESRDSLMPLKFVREEKLETEFIPRYISEPLKELFLELDDDMTLDRVTVRKLRGSRQLRSARLPALSDRLAASNPPLLTHSWLSDLLTDSIDWLEEDPALNR
ncbi:hypothetical protein EW146_g4616 [Bondarzewia mesenterica]|uniref:Protein kinase domain-containing protein n=1 Tax=Bondarzewia mesenterica TaxID=1095465 RepID=A0A4S4LU10_9AGAM|nr:hypothetical protein EW146_g4616 [Bondarzewia mesenterica]